jgi:hypothetical protein
MKYSPDAYLLHESNLMHKQQLYCSCVANIAMRTKLFAFFELFLQDTFLHLPVG